MCETRCARANPLWGASDPWGIRTPPDRVPIYYPGAQRHLALEKDAPTTRRVQPPTKDTWSRSRKLADYIIATNDVQPDASLTEGECFSSRHPLRTHRRVRDVWRRAEKDGIRIAKSAFEVRRAERQREPSSHSCMLVDSDRRASAGAVCMCERRDADRRSRSHLGPTRHELTPQVTSAQRPISVDRAIARAS